MSAETMKLLGFNVHVWIVNIVGFALLYWVMRRFVWTHIAHEIESRGQRVARQLAEAKGKLQEAENRLAQAEQRLQEAAVEAEQIRKQALEEAKAEAEQVRQQAKQQAQQIVLSAREEAVRLREQALAEAKREVATIAAAMAERVLQAVLDEDRHRALIDEAIEDIDRVVSEGGLN